MTADSFLKITSRGMTYQFERAIMDPYNEARAANIPNGCSTANGLSIKYAGASCENNHELRDRNGDALFSCVVDCARAAYYDPECAGSNRLIYNSYYSAHSPSWGCRCCKDGTFQAHHIWDLYEYTDDIVRSDDEPAPWLEGPKEALPKSTVYEIVMDRQVAFAALAVMALMSMNLLLCFYCGCGCGGKGVKPVVYRKVEMVSAAED